MVDELKIVVVGWFLDRVLQEFFYQGDLEKDEGLPVSPNMDRDVTIQDELRCPPFFLLYFHLISINFCDFIVAPFFLSLANAIPEVKLCCQNLRDNRDKWMTLLRNRINTHPMAEEKR